MTVFSAGLSLRIGIIFVRMLAMAKAVCIGGKNNIAVDALFYLLNVVGISKKDICVIPVKTDTGADSWQKSLVKAASETGIEQCELTDICNQNDIIFISLEFDRIINPKKFMSEHLFNIHFSLLPKYKGMYTSTIPILNGEKTTGVTLHLIDDGIDTGPVIYQREFEIDINDTARSLYFKYLDNALCIFKLNIHKLFLNDFSYKEQDILHSSYYGKNPSIFNQKIYLRQTSYQIHNQIRALCFKEFQLPSINGQPVSGSALSSEFIGYNRLVELNDRFIISGIDGYKITVKKDDYNNAVY
jgi:methionyl-tRNA formyltransferase